MSKQMTKIVNFGTHFDSILGSFWDLRITEVKVHIQILHFCGFSRFLRIFGDPKNAQIGGLFLALFWNPFFFVFFRKQAPKIGPTRGPFLRRWT